LRRRALAKQEPERKAAAERDELKRRLEEERTQREGFQRYAQLTP
jgi:hypothetical protein